MARCALALAAAPLLIGASPAGSLDVAIDGLRSQRGQLQLCLTTNPTHFPDCEGDPAARRISVPAATPAIRFDGLPSGGYAIALIHDENGNNRLDTRLGLPVEGFGFSRNPVILFGPPRFAAARFSLSGGPSAQAVRVKYLL